MTHIVISIFGGHIKFLALIQDTNEGDNTTMKEKDKLWLIQTFTKKVKLSILQLFPTFKAKNNAGQTQIFPSQKVSHEIIENKEIWENSNPTARKQKTKYEKTF